VTTPLNVAILAAGHGKRMHSALPKVLHPLAGRPLAAHIIDTARTLTPRAMVVVVGNGAERVTAALAAPDLVFVHQDPPLGTGDAARVALAAMPSDGVTLIGLADVPLAPAAGLSSIVDHARRGDVGLLTARVPDATGLGRIVRTGDGGVKAIVEDRDASPSERAIDEINTGFIAAPTALLTRWIAQLAPHNAQREYYLTDIVAMAVAEGVPVTAHIADDEREVRGVNDRAQLVFAERIIQTRKAKALLESGTWIADPQRIDVRGVLSCERDVRIDVGCVFEGIVALGEGVDIGPRDTAEQAFRKVQDFKGTEADVYHADVPEYYLPPKKDVYTKMEALIWHFKIIMGETDIPAGEVYHSVEGGNGELGFYLISDGGRTPYRLRFRRPCFIYYQAYSEITKGGMLSDAIITMSSMNLIAGEMDG